MGVGFENGRADSLGIVFGFEFGLRFGVGVGLALGFRVGAEVGVWVGLTDSPDVGAEPKFEAGLICKLRRDQNIFR